MHICMYGIYPYNFIIAFVFVCVCAHVHTHVQACFLFWRELTVHVHVFFSSEMLIFTDFQIIFIY